jgi:hypothetical protein
MSVGNEVDESLDAITEALLTTGVCRMLRYQPALGPRPDATVTGDASVRRRLLDNAEQDVGQRDERVQCRDNQAGKKEPPYAAAASALELRVTLLALDLGRDERELDCSQLTIGAGPAGSYLPEPRGQDCDADPGE